MPHTVSSTVRPSRATGPETAPLDRDPSLARTGSSRLNLVFTLDYELHGNGEGRPLELMVSPTARLLGLLEGYGAKLTIMAETVEIRKFREFRDASGSDDWAYAAIEAQLKNAVAQGHDVQLHLHPAYATAQASNGKWVLDYRDYDLAQLGYERIVGLVREGKEYLETLLQPVRPGYRCYVFRSANWSMSPSDEIVRALRENDFKIDTSVFKYGFRDELVRFDYSKADSETVPWPVDPTDVCRRDESGELFEFPIYCESRPIWSFLSANRVYRVVQGRIHPLPDAAPPGDGKEGRAAAKSERATSVLRKGTKMLSLLSRRHALKLDFNQCSGSQMIAALKRAKAGYGGLHGEVPVVLIGHSKLFNAFNERQLRKFLAYVVSHPADFGFATFDGFNLEGFRSRGQA
jgi:hypothetical protein